MKKLISILMLCMLTFSMVSQAPALIPYQAIARDTNGQPIVNTTFIVRFTLHEHTASGASVWQELQSVSTSELGLFTAQMGSSVSLNSVNWASGAKFMQVEIDLGNGFVDMGTQQLLSVPYAMYAAASGSTMPNQGVNGFLGVSYYGDTLRFENGRFAIIPGISEVNVIGLSSSCGAVNVLNPERIYSSLTDQEGNNYKTIVIGSQEWMAENLNTSIYRNGDAIATDLSNADWSDMGISEQGAWAYYNNDPSFSCPYGKLYNWYACADPRGLCPTGWHVPSDEDWNVLIDFLDPIASGGSNYSNVAGNSMKSRGTQYWTFPISSASNSSGLSCLPGSYRLSNGESDPWVNFNGYWWSSTTTSVPNEAWCRVLAGTAANAIRLALDPRSGLSIRCLRDGL